MHVGPLGVEEVLARGRRVVDHGSLQLAGGEGSGRQAEIHVAAVGTAQAQVAPARVDDFRDQRHPGLRMAEAAQQLLDRRTHGAFPGGRHDAARPGGPVDQEVAGLGQEVGTRAGQIDVAGSIEGEQAGFGEGHVHPHTRAHADRPVVGAHGHDRVGAGMTSEGAHVCVGDVEALVEERPQARRQRPVVARKRRIEGAPPEVKELVGEGEVGKEDVPPGAGGAEVEQALELSLDEAHGLEVAPLRGAIAAFGEGLSERPSLVEMLRPVAHEGSRGFRGRGRHQVAVRQEDAGACPVEEEVGAIRREGEQTKEDRQLLAGQGHGHRGEAAGVARDPGLEPGRTRRILIDRQEQGVEALRRVLGIVVEQAVDRRIAHRQLHLARGTEERRPASPSRRRAPGKIGRAVDRVVQHLTLVAGHEGQAVAEVPAEALALDVRTVRIVLGDAEHRGVQALPCGRHPQRLGPERLAAIARYGFEERRFREHDLVPGDAVATGPGAGEEGGVSRRRLGGERRDGPARGGAPLTQPRQVRHHAAGHRVVHHGGRRPVEARQDEPRLPAHVGKAERGVERGSLRLLPGGEPERAQALGGAGEAGREPRALALEEPRVVRVVVAVVLRGVGEVAKARARAVGTEGLGGFGERLDEGFEHESHRLFAPVRRARLHFGLDLAEETVDRLVLPTRVEAGLARELAVVVQHRVEGHVGVAHVVAEDGRALQRAGRVAGAERGHEVAVDLGRPPGHAAALARRGAESREVLLLHARHAREGPFAEGVQVEVVVGAFAFEARTPPQVGVDRVLGHIVRVAVEELAQRRGQGRDCLAVHEAVGGEAPGRGGGGMGQAQRREDARGEPVKAHGPRG